MLSNNHDFSVLVLIVHLYILYTACINYTRPNYAFSDFFLIDREKQDKLLFISRSIFNQIQPSFNQFFLDRWEMHSKNSIWICLVFFELSCSQTNTHTHIHTYTHTHIHTYTHTRIHTYTYTHTHIQTQMIT
jgi:hypothetical protein